MNGSQQFTATGHYNDGSVKDLTSTASWSPPPPKSTIATVSASGLATGVKPGTVKISAKVGSLTGSATLTVTP